MQPSNLFNWFQCIYMGFHTSSSVLWTLLNWLIHFFPPPSLYCRDKLTGMGRSVALESMYLDYCLLQWLINTKYVAVKRWTICISTKSSNLLPKTHLIFWSAFQIGFNSSPSVSSLSSRVRVLSDYYEQGVAHRVTKGCSRWKVRREGWAAWALGHTVVRVLSGGWHGEADRAWAEQTTAS